MQRIHHTSNQPLCLSIEALPTNRAISSCTPFQRNLSQHRASHPLPLNNMDKNVSSSFLDATKSFRTRLDAFSNLHTCHICNERYLGMLVHSSHKDIACRRCIAEKGLHRFSLTNNMDPLEQPIDHEQNTQNSTSFMVSLPKKQRELQIIKESLDLDHEPNTKLDWPHISSTPINEYTTEGLFDMAFPTLFPNGTAKPMQPRARDVQLHEYALHLMRYHDNRFGQHPRFTYFLLNLMMRHRSQALASVFIKRKIDDNIPNSIENLRSHLTNLPDCQLAEELMHFGSIL